MNPPTRVPAAVLCAALSLTWVSDVLAQTADQTPMAHFYRPMLTVGFRNVGIQGSFLSYRYGMQYPNTGSPPWEEPAAGQYGTIRLSGVHNWAALDNVVRYGHGVWTMTSDARVVYTGVRAGMQDAHITPMQYDVSADPELSHLGKQWYHPRRPTVKLGYGERYPEGVEETSLGANWWPGSDLIEEGRKTQPYDREPVHIYNWNFCAYPTYDQQPEEIVVTQWTNSQGLTTVERGYAWSHPDFDDLFLDEYVIENTGDTNGDGIADLPPLALNELYVGFQDRYDNGTAGRGVGYGYDQRMDDWYAFDPDLKLLYMWDGDHPLHNPWDDTGDPYKDDLANPSRKIGQGENTLMCPAHLGVAVVAYTDDSTSPYAFNARDIDRGYVVPEGDQPYAARFWESYSEDEQGDPSSVEMTAGEMYSEVLGGGRQIDPDPDHPSGQFSMLVFGPYDLPPGAKLKIVLAYVAGHPGQMLGNTDMFTWARKGNQAELPLGLDALKQNVDAARFAYANAYDIPDCPPDVNFRTGSNASAQMRVDWPDAVESASHPDYAGSEAADITGYRVYRSTWFDVGPWELLADIAVGTVGQETPTYRVSREGDLYVCEDLQSAAGFFYHYSVRAYAGPHSDWSPGNPKSPLSMSDLPVHIQSHLQVGQEGGWSALTQRIHADESPFAVPSTETEASRATVLVVPNPYIPDASHAYPGSNKIRFVGMPSKCRILVFSASGEVVSNVTHNDATKAEHDYDQQTWVYNGQIAAGVYFWVVENLLDGPDLGRLQKGTLMVIP